MQTATFGQWLKTRRKALDLTRVQIAQQVGCAEITLGKIERDQRRPSKQIAELLAIALRIPDDACEVFVQFARGAGQPPVLDQSDMNPTHVHSQPPTNLPAPLTSFIDRAHELTELREKLLHPDVRLITLVGPPGIGKTRLGIQAAQTLLDHFSDGVWFVALAPVTDPNLVLPAIARIFDMSEAGVLPLLARVQNFLRPKQVLLVLDNCEQVLEATPIVSDLLKAAPNLKVIATSRESLHIYGEHEYPMPTLSLPPLNQKLTVEQLAQFNAIKLFVARAEAVQPSFTLNAETAQAVADICSRLDGVPLAIELAASRLRQFTLPKLRDALNDAPLPMLVGTARDVEPRQRTRRNAIQWSTNLLNANERAVFNRLGVFVGGCTTEAALVVCELGDDSILHALAERNLIKRDANERWTMLEMIREFALEQLFGDGLEPVRQRHAEYFASILKHDRDESYRIIDVEQHNARAALRCLLDHKDPLLGELIKFMGSYFQQTGLTHESRRTMSEALSADTDWPLIMRYHLLVSVSIDAFLQHDFEEGLHYAYKALALSREMNLPAQVSEDLTMLSRIFYEMDDCVQAKAIALEALEIGRRVQDAVAMAGALDHAGQAELMLGNVSEAEAHFEEAYALCRPPDWHQHVYAGLACLGLGGAALSHGDYNSALRFLREGLDRSKAASVLLWILDVLAGVIGTMPRRTTTDVCRAAKIWGAAEALNEKMGLVNAPADRRRTDALIADARSRITPKTFEAAWAEGRKLSMDEVIALVMES